MTKFRHTRRSVILFLLLTPLTLGIYPIVVLTHIGQEVNRIYEGREGYRKSMNFVGVFFLGIITLGIVPIVWMWRVCSKIGNAAYELEIRKPHISGGSYLLLGWLFAIFVIPYIIFLYKFLHTVNALERTINARLESAAAAEAQSEILQPEEAVEGKPAPAEEAPAEEAQAEPVQENVENQDNAPAEEPAAEAKPAPAEAPAQQNEEPAEAPKPAYPTARKWRVRIGDSDKAVKVFDSKEEAIAYARGLSRRCKGEIHIQK